MNLRHETQRLTFLEERDGPVEAKNFARRTLAIYKAAVKRKQRGYGRAYRRALIESCLDFRTYLRSRKYLSPKYQGLPTLTELIEKFGNWPVPEVSGGVTKKDTFK